MKITKPVIYDLLPAYLDGSASDETQMIVEEFAKNDEEIRLFLNLNNGNPKKEKGIDMSTLNSAKKIIALRSWLLGIGLFLLLLPITTYGSGTEIVWQMWRDAREVAIAAIIIGVLVLIYRQNLANGYKD